MTKAAPSLSALRTRASDVAILLKAVSHSNRLLIACQLMEGEQSVSDIESATGVAQPVLSRELGRLRRDGLLDARRASRMVYYRLADDRLPALIGALCDAFGAPRARRSPAVKPSAFAPPPKRTRKKGPSTRRGTARSRPPRRRP